VAGLVGGLARDMLTLVISRVLIGLGTSAGYPSAMLLIRRRASAVGLHKPPGSVIGGLTATSAATLAIGPTAGGLLVGWLDWRAVFWVNVPVTAATFVMALIWIAKDTETVRGHSLRDMCARIDLPGVVAFGAAMTALLVFLLSLPRLDWIALAATVALSVALVVIELRVSGPFFDIRLLGSNPALTRTYIRYCFTLLGIYVVLYGLTEWIEAAHGLSGYEAGLALIPMGVLSAVTGKVVSGYIGKLRLSLIVAAVALVLGAAGLLFLTSHSPLATVICVTAVFGLVAGFGNVSNQTALYIQAPAGKVGTASGLLRTFGYVGSIASATITGMAFRTRVSDSGLHVVGAILVGVGVVVLVMTVLDRRLGAAPAAEQRGTPADDAVQVKGVSAASAADVEQT
jgi:MFS family permease